MPVIDGKKFACARCIKGHRSSSCQHTDRPVFEIKKKGRPPSQCVKCRQMRKVSGVHTRCNCKEADSAPPTPPNELAEGSGEPAHSKVPNLKALKAIQKATIQRAYMCQCLTGGTCICGPSRSGCKTLPTAKVAKSAHPVETADALQGCSRSDVSIISTTSSDLPVASTSAVPYTPLFEISACNSVNVKPSQLYRPEKPSPLGMQDEASRSWLSSQHGLQEGAAMCCRSKAQPVMEVSAGDPMTVQTAIASAPLLRKGGCCSVSQKSKSDVRPKFEPYTIPILPPQPSETPSCCMITPPLTVSSSNNPTEASLLDANENRDSFFKDNTSESDLFPPSAMVFEGLLPTDWSSAQSDNQIGFYGSGGDEDTPFDKHVRDNPAYQSASTDPSLVWPVPNVDDVSHQKEPLGMLFDDWVFGSVYVPPDFLSQYQPEQIHPETQSGCSGCGEGCMCGDQCECAHAFALSKYLLREQALSSSGNSAPDPVDLAFVHSVLGPPSVTDTVQNWQQANVQDENARQHRVLSSRV